MRTIVLIPAAAALDLLAGDPEWLPHPVRFIGEALSFGEKHLCRPEQSAAWNLIAGTFLTSGIVWGTYVLATSTRRLPRTLRVPFELWLAQTCLAARNLHGEATAVLHALEAGDLTTARQRLARIVGRDTAHLDASEISRAVIETVAESLSDGVLAPLFYLALGGLPLGLAYKAINTLDSMIGHTAAPYFYFGKAAARLDDAANYLPARLTAACIALAGPNRKASFQTWHSDGHKHKSPNAGRPEAAMAGALGVRLGGRNTYSGDVVDAPVLGARFPLPVPAEARRAVSLIAPVTLLGLAACMLLAAVIPLLTRPRSV